MRLFTVSGTNTAKMVVRANIIKARGWKHAQNLADDGYSLDKYDSVIMRIHPKGSRQEYCDSCDGVGLMEGWNRRDGSSCPKCKGSGLVVMDKQEDGSFKRYVLS